MVWLKVVGFPVSFDGVRHECIQGQPGEQGKQETTGIGWQQVNNQARPWQPAND
jgi:hypothetical protein